MRSSKRTTHRFCAALSMLLLALVASSAFAQCGEHDGVTGVAVAFVDLDDDGTPDIDPELSNKERNERARISSELAGKLSIDVDADDDVFPQVRVLLENHEIATGHQGTGVFSIYEIFESTDDEIQVWADEDPGDEDSGQYRLFENTSVANIASVQATVFPQAVSFTEIWRSDVYSSEQHFCEPDADTFLTESTIIETDRRFALLVPHGGEIEFDTSEQVDPLLDALDAAGIDANAWDVRGEWHSGSDESEHWHITSKEVSEDGFPGLEEMLAEAPFDTTRDFQYVASLHGMNFRKEGLVLGGRASREAKCLIGSRVRERMAAESLPLPAIYVWNYDKEESESVEVPHGDGVATITGERGSDPGLSGTSSDNIVNRLSPNADGAVGFGGFQIEESQDLRAAGYRDIVAEEIGLAFAEMITKPDLFAASGSPICDALEAGTPAPTAEIRGLAWWDGGDGLRAGSELPAEGVSVELLDSSDAIVAITTTSADGSYSFPGLGGGTYRVRFDVSAAIDFAPQDQGGDETRDSDASTTSGETAAIALAAHGLIEQVDAGLLLAPGNGSVGDFVWSDDGDGLQAGSEPGLDGALVELFDDRGVLLESQLTANGLYGFSGLPPADYVLRFTPPAGYQPAPRGEGQDASVDSDVDSNFDIAFTVTSNSDSDLTLDAGFVLGCADATLVAFGSEWTFSSSATTGWTDVDFPEIGWNEEAMAPFGYASDVETIVPDTDSVYFRLAFELEDPELFDALELTLFAGDGAVVYLNGAEVARSNVPVSAQGSSLASFSIAQPTLLEGSNVLAVEVHETSGALVFDLELAATICRPCVEELRIDADRGTYMRENSSKNRGDESEIEMDADTPKAGLFAWPTGALPADAEVLHAAVELRVTENSPNRFYFFPLNQAWDEETADWYHASDPADEDWNDPGALDGELDHERAEPLGSFRFAASAEEEDGGPYTGVIVLNVSGRELVQSWARGERANHGLYVPGEGSDDDKLVVDSDETENPPRLHVVYRSCSP